MDPQAVAECLAAIDAMLRDRPERECMGEFPRVGQAAGLARPPRRAERSRAARAGRGNPEAARRTGHVGPAAAVPFPPDRSTPCGGNCCVTRPSRSIRRRYCGDLERYEQTGLAADARLLARDCRWLALSPSEKSRQLGDAVDAHYRNANVRVAISGELLNRLIPKRDPEYAKVNDTLLGLPVHGQSLTGTAVRVLLVPDPDRALLALQVTGHVSSLTSATSGPATFVNDTNSMYAAVKPMEVDLAGASAWVQTASRRLQQDDAAEREDRFRRHSAGWSAGQGRGAARSASRRSRSSPAK